MKRAIFGFLILVLMAVVLHAQRPGVAPDAQQITPLLPGQKAPDVTFKTLDNEDFNLLEEVSQKPILLIFYRGGW